MNKTAGCAALASAVTLASLSAAATLPSYDFGACTDAFDCRRLSAAELDRMRGGFSFMNGSSELQISIGISRAVFINDELVAVTQQLVLPTLQQLRDGTYLANGALLGTVSASSQPAAQRSAAPSSAPAGGTSAGASPSPASAGAAPAGGGGSGGSSAPAPGSSVANAASAAAAGNPGAVQVNGVPVALSAPTVVSADELRALVIQNGPANIATPSASEIRANAMATVLQNTLDNQTIRTMTTLTATTNTLSAFRDAAFREAIGQATTDLLR